MFEQIKQAFNQHKFLGPKDLLDLVNIAKLKRVKKDDQLLSVGDLNYNAVIVLNGLLRHFVIDEEGVEHTLLLVPELMHTGSLQTLINSKPADENIIAIEDSLLLEFDIRALDKLADSNIRIMKMLNQRHKFLISEIADRIKFLTVLKPEDRYNHFCKTFPKLEQRIKQKHLASYLGITPTSLSRLRARIAQS
jgi:CRP-like cAMP-binding protein